MFHENFPHHQIWKFHIGCHQGMEIRRYEQIFQENVDLNVLDPFHSFVSNVPSIIIINVTSLEAFDARMLRLLLQLCITVQHLWQNLKVLNIKSNQLCID